MTSFYSLAIMDNWENNLINWLNNAQNEWESFYTQVNQHWQKNTEEMEKIFTQLTGEVEETFTTELNELLTEVDDFVIEVVKLFVDDDYLNDVDDFSYFLDEDEFNSWLQDTKIKPNLEINPACVGCSNYHGHSYNGNLLVCGIHPYGWKGETCPDWQE
jgi:hypothetical protein